MDANQGARLSEFGLHSYVSQRGLADVLRKIKDQGLPQHTSRIAIKRSREASVNVDTAYGPMLKSFLCQDQVVQYIDPAAFLSHACSSCPCYAQRMNTTFAAHPSSWQQPWRLVLYLDEISPGNQLKSDNRRKVWAVYYSFLEFGTQALSSENLWFFLFVLRSNTVSALGGLAVLGPHVLDCFYKGHDIRQGIVLRCSGQVHLLCAKLQVIIGDEGAIKALWDNKGASGTFCCVLCRNIVKFSSGLHLHDHTNSLKPHTETNAALFVRHTNASLQSTVQLLGAQFPHLSKTAFERLEQSMGWNYRPEGLLLSEWFPGDASPADHTMFDWMHVYAVHGVANVEIALLMSLLSTVNIGHDLVHAFLQNVVWPKHINSKGMSGKLVFEKRLAPNSALSCSASELLSVYSPLRFFLMTRVIPLPALPSRVVSACHSFFALAEVLDTLRMIPRGEVRVETISTAITVHLRSFIHTYGPESCTPKFHYAMDLPYLYQKHGTLLSCWVHERKHKEIKRFANSMHTAVNFEANVTEAVLLAHLADLSVGSGLPARPALINAVPAAPELAGFVTDALGANGDVLHAAEAICAWSTSCHSDDVVIFRWEDELKVGQIWFHASLDDRGVSCLSEWVSLGQNKFRRTNNPILIDTFSIVTTCIWLAADGNDCFVVPSKLNS
jgi:hypothetical protein